MEVINDTGTVNQTDTGTGSAMGDCPQCHQPHGSNCGHVVVARMACILCRKVLRVSVWGAVGYHELPNGKECTGSCRVGHFIDIIVWPVLISEPRYSGRIEDWDPLATDHREVMPQAIELLRSQASEQR